MIFLFLFLFVLIAAGVAYVAAAAAAAAAIGIAATLLPLLLLLRGLLFLAQLLWHLLCQTLVVFSDVCDVIIGLYQGAHFLGSG